MTIKNTYHHGDLRNALLVGATEMLAQEGVHGLSLRQVAKHIGVSHNAPYQHFPDKEALIAAIAEQGFIRLGEAMDDAVATLSAQDAPSRLSAIGRVYVSFMLTYRHYFEVMFGQHPHKDYPTLSGASIKTFNQLVQVIIDGQATGQIRAGDPQEMAGVIWVAIHGLSAVMIAQKMPPQIIGQENPLELVTTFVQLICDGLRV
jgi:AcrR family transcriptional regulator